MIRNRDSYIPRIGDFARTPFVRLAAANPTNGERSRGRPLNTAMRVEVERPGELERDVEAALVLSWRFEVLSRAGYPRDDAFRLARGEADLHRAAELLERGCPAETAVKILL